MKTTKRLITTILALSILLSILAGITVSALELDEDVIIDDSSYEEELEPMAARGCNYYAGGYYFSAAAWNHLNGDRPVPISVLSDVINSGTGMPDPQGSSATMYYATGYVNGKLYTFEVLYNSVTNTIYHYLYR